mgnify:CR=1 FL=1
MKRKLMFLAAAITLALSPLWGRSLFNAAAQNRRNNAAQEIERPLDWLNVQTLGDPARTHFGAPLDPVYGAAEASFDQHTYEPVPQL